MRHVLPKIATLAVAFATPALAQQAQTVPGPYVQISLGSGFTGHTKLSAAGVGSLGEDLNAGLFAAAAVGKSFGSGLALESEVLYLDNDIKSGDFNRALGFDVDPSVRTLGLMVNGHYAFAPIGPLTAHVGAGVGYGQTKIRLAGESESDSNVMWQAIAGLSYPVSPTVSFDLSYRYVHSPKFKASDAVASIKDQTNTQVLAVGARYKF